MHRGRDGSAERPAARRLVADHPQQAVARDEGLEIPAPVRATLGLDDEPCWVIVSEYNIDDWPNAGIAPVPGRAAKFAYGHLPPGLFNQIKAAFLDCFDPRRAVRR